MRHPLSETRAGANLREPLLIVFGNRFRRDDGVGPAVLEHFSGRDGYHCHGDPLGLAQRLQGRRRVVVVDCLQGPSPGRRHRWDWGDQPPEISSRRLSSHGFDLIAMFTLIAAHQPLPQQLSILALEGCDFGWGEGFSAQVEAAMPAFLEQLEQELHLHPLR